MIVPPGVLTGTPRFFPARRSRSSRKPMQRVRAVAIRLVGAAATTTQRRARHARHDAPGAADDLHVAAHLQRSVGLWIDRQRSVAQGSMSVLPEVGSPVAANPGS
jgi:hypothetical protein